MMLVMDYEIAKQTKLLPILEIAEKVGLTENEIEMYGNDKAKIHIEKNRIKKESHLILVTSTSPTPFGEGKTTLSIGIADSLCAIGEKAIVILREPSLGPVFGNKGGATGGGMSQVAPMDDINLHFTGDIHAVTSANNLLCAIIDNHIFQGNELGIDIETIQFDRCLDINDRALRKVALEIIGRKDAFQISVASEIMAILCLSTDIEDLKQRIGQILIGYTKEGREVTSSDLQAEGALTVLLKNAIKPNLVQTLENNPALIHGGPFANIAHGCNSVIATKLGMELADYAITEAGFGSDMGALKFLDIKCRTHGLQPDVIVINTTVKGLAYNGNGIVKEGICNLGYHIENMRSFNENILVVLNLFESDTEEEINCIKQYCQEQAVSFVISECYKKGSEGGIELASKIKEMCKKEKKDLPMIYSLEDSILDKINKVCKERFHASSVVVEEEAKVKIEKLKHTNYDKLPICIAKTPYSISDNAKLLGNPKDFTMTVTDIKVNTGAGFITIYMGSVMTMPGLSKKANYIQMDIKDDTIIGLF